jgi:tetratricopeptide (TPR) repeat protein
MSSDAESPLHAERIGNEDFRIPSLGEVIGHAVQILDLGSVDRSGLLQPSKSSTAKRWFAGNVISLNYEEQIIGAFADALVAAEVLPLPPALEAPRSTIVAAIKDVICTDRERWGTFTALTRQVASHDKPNELRKVAVRLIVIDLALRTLGAAVLLADRADPVTAIPLPRWLDAGHAKGVLRKLVDRCKRAKSWTSREDFAERLGVEDTMLDRWLDGTHRPRQESLQSLATAFAALLPDAKASVLAAELRVGYALVALRERLVKQFGEEFVDDCDAAWHFVQYRMTQELDPELAQKSIFASGELHPLIDPANPADTSRIVEAARGHAMGLLLQGVHGETGAVMTHKFAHQCADWIWATELLRASGDWTLRIQEVARNLGNTKQGVPVLAKELNVSEEQAHKFHELAVPLFAHVDQTFVPEIMAYGRTDMPPMYDLRSPQTPRQLARDGEKRVVRIKGDNKFSARNRAIQFRAAMDAGQFDAAITHGERMIELDPEHVQNQYFFGAFLGQIGQVERALKHLWISAKLDPLWDRPVVEIAVVLQNAGREAEAIAHAEEYIPKLAKPTDFGWYTLGRLRRLAGRCKDALIAIELALSLNPQHVHAVIEAVYTCVDMGDKRGAKSYAKRARELGVDIDRLINNSKL